MIIEAGFDSTRIMRQMMKDTWQDDIEAVPRMNYYYIDEPADDGDNLDFWISVTDWIRENYSDPEIVISGYKRTDQLKDHVNSYSDKVMFSSYKHWWEFLGLWISWPEDPDQRPDWADMQSRFTSKFSTTWVGAHRDEKEYDDLMGKAKNLSLQGVYLYQHEPHDDEVDDSNLEKFSDAASKHGFLSTYFQQIIDFYKDGNFVERRFVGPSYVSSIPSEFDHSVLTFNDYTVTNNRIEDYFATIRIIAGGANLFRIPAEKNASFNTYDEVILKPGFHAEKGSEFRASIGRE